MFLLRERSKSTTAAEKGKIIQAKARRILDDFAQQRRDAIEQYNLQPFTLNVLDKRRTMIEKLVSLIRFSFSENRTLAIASKIRHFYDLYFLANDAQCAEYIQSPDFETRLKIKNKCSLKLIYFVI